MRIIFDGHREPVIGLGLELQVISSSDASLCPAAREIVENLNDPRVRIGLYESVLEVDTSMQGSLQDAMGELTSIIRNIRQYCHPRQMTLLSAGTHPLGQWSTMKMSTDPNRAPLIERLAWVGRRMAIYGLRIYVGVPDGEKAIAVAGALRVLVPLFSALSASSPYWNGQDTGLASARARIIENVPNAGIPPQMINWSEFVRFVKTLRAAEAIHDFAEIWWDVRPSYERGAIRLQACDCPHTLREISIIAAIAYATVCTLLQEYRSGHRMWDQKHWVIRENKWRAARFGLEAEVIRSQEGETIPLRDLLDSTVEKILPISRDLGCEDEILQVEEILAYGPGYVRQRMFRHCMSPEEAVLAVAREFETDELGAEEI